MAYVYSLFSVVIAINVSKTKCLNTECLTNSTAFSCYFFVITIPLFLHAITFYNSSTQHIFQTSLKENVKKG